MAAKRYWCKNCGQEAVQEEIGGVRKLVCVFSARCKAFPGFVSRNPQSMLTASNGGRSVTRQRMGYCNADGSGGRILPHHGSNN